MKYNLFIDESGDHGLADLIAYPIARYILEPDRINPSFEAFKNKFYEKAGKRYGLKIFP